MADVKRLSSPVFVGRRSELADVTAAYDRAAAGEASTILVSGEAGVGKSRFLVAFAAAAHEAGAIVLRGACVELGQGILPYAPVVEALRPLVQVPSCDPHGRC